MIFFSLSLSLVSLPRPLFTLFPLFPPKIMRNKLHHQSDIFVHCIFQYRGARCARENSSGKEKGSGGWVWGGERWLFCAPSKKTTWFFFRLSLSSLFSLLFFLFVLFCLRFALDRFLLCLRSALPLPQKTKLKGNTGKRKEKEIPSPPASLCLSHAPPGAGVSPSSSPRILSLFALISAAATLNDGMAALAAWNARWCISCALA